MNKSQKTKHLNERLGALPSPFDYRSIAYQLTSPALEEYQVPPDSFSGLDEYLPYNFPNNQGNIGSCVGWDFSMAMETIHTLLGMDIANMPYRNHVALWMHEAWNSLTDFEKEIYMLATTDFSAGYIYYWSKEYNFPKIPQSMEGSTNFGAAKALHKMGIALESEIATDISKPWFPDGVANLSAEALSRAQKRVISSYHRVDPSPISVKLAMMGELREMPYKMPNGKRGCAPIPSAFPVYESFTEAYDNGGVVPMPKAGEKLRGGHSSLLAGWKDVDGVSHYKNFGSWGKTLGDGGDFWLPVDYPFYPNDFFLLVPGVYKPVPPPEPKLSFFCQLVRTLGNLGGCNRV